MKNNEIKITIIYKEVNGCAEVDVSTHGDKRTLRCLGLLELAKNNILKGVSNPTDKEDE